MQQSQPANKAGQVVEAGRRVEQAVIFSPIGLELRNRVAVEAQHELFGPVTCLYRVKDFDEALALANSTTFGLTGAIHTANMHRVQEFIARYRAGLVSVNGPTYGAGPHMPFGGVKNSGNGFREPGTEALDVYTEWKTVVINHDPARV